MSDEIDQANDEAKKKLTENLEKLQGKIEKDDGEPDITDGELVNDSKLGKTKDLQKEFVKDEIEEIIDKIQQAVNRNEIVKADCLMRKLRKTIKKRMTGTSGKRKEMLQFLVLARKEKRKITAPVDVAFQDEEFDVGEEISFGYKYQSGSVLGYTPSSFSANAPVSAIAGVSEADEMALSKALSIETVEDLATHPAVQFALQVVEIARKKDC